jgi:hypothetical protein
MEQLIVEMKYAATPKGKVEAHYIVASSLEEAIKLLKKGG